MPVSIQRYNQKGKKHPNDRIIFVKALPGNDHDTAEDFLMRIAAICKPIMEKNSLSVMTLEEHEPNREFVGRNFNAGEVIQLVLKAKASQRWLPFRTVQMVMMHELAHCKQMNHSRAFWAVRNAYADELRELWGRRYTGDGLWGQGQSLYANQYAEDQMPDPSSFVENLCGGTYRSRGRKRKRGGKTSQLSYAERKQRKIEKKFGVKGQALGADEEQRVLFENGKDKGRSRVAKSKRARDLRAQAALSRFRLQKSQEEVDSQQKSDLDENDSTDDDSDTAGEDSTDEVEATDQHGGKLVDSKGRGLIRICDAEDSEHDLQARNELSELTFCDSAGPLRTRSVSEEDCKYLPKTRYARKPHEGTAEAPHETQIDTAPPEFTRKSSFKGSADTKVLTEAPERDATQDAPQKRHPEQTDGEEQTCSACSLANPMDQLTCMACANVLDTSRLSRYWECSAEACAGATYLNSTDAGRCGLCGALRP